MAEFATHQVSTFWVGMSASKPTLSIFDKLGMQLNNNQLENWTFNLGDL